MIHIQYSYLQQIHINSDVTQLHCTIEMYRNRNILLLACKFQIMYSNTQSGKKLGYNFAIWQVKFGGFKKCFVKIILQPKVAS